MSAPTVLVVDDDPEIVDLVEVALRDRGYKVLVAVDGGAVDIAREGQPDLILLDLLMPGMDGVEIGNRLRSHPSTASIPIVVMSARELLRTTASKLLANDRLAKPFELRDLYTTVDRFAPTPNL